MSIQEAERLIRNVPAVAEIGPGIHPQTKYSHAYIGIEPCDEYADKLEERGLLVLRMTGLEGLQLLGKVDSILLFDVLEHMPRDEGLAILDLCLQRARQQVVVFTTLGFIEQSYKPGDKDAWGMNGCFWQTHRSGWQPEDFPGWQVFADPVFHGEKGGAMFAIHG